MKVELPGEIRDKKCESNPVIIVWNELKNCGVGGVVLDDKIKKLVEETLARWPRLPSEREAEIRAMMTRYQDELAASAFESMKESRRREGLVKEMASRVWLT
jgi:hypothetical protein